jgi:perosamine synthetase
METMTDMDMVNRFAQKHRLKVIEDAAQAISVFHKGRHAGTIGDVGTFSFFADKTITTGEGGFVVTNNEEIFRSLQYLRNQGRVARGTFIHPAIGYNFRMTDLQCAVGLAQIEKLNEIIDRKKTIEAWYQSCLKNIPQISFFQKEADTNLVPFRVSILCERAHSLMDYLAKHDIEPRSFFYPLHLQPAFAYLKTNPAFSQRMADENFPNTIYGYEHGVMLPSFPSITKKQIEYVAHVVGKFYDNR